MSQGTGNGYNMTILAEFDVEEADLEGVSSFLYFALYASRVKLMDWRDYISSDPAVCHGAACITGTRVMVTVILDNLADGLSVEDIIKSYPAVSPEAVRAVLHYAAELARDRIVPSAR